MFKLLLSCLSLAFVMMSCSSLKPYTSDKPVATSSSRSATASAANKEVRFLNDIAVNPANTAPSRSSARSAGTGGDIGSYINRSSAVEKATDLQLKYAVLLNTEVELLEDNALLEHVDEWYGTKYRYGGTSKSGIDCSAFVQAIYLSAFATTLPRTAREQYRSAHIISATEMKCGDLVFFNTTGGISHVGIYLQNNKFIHASTSYGVTISDLFDPYYLRRFIGVGRVDKPEVRVK